jgi:hypothetical protein
VIPTSSNVEHQQIKASGTIWTLVHEILDVGHKERIDVHGRFCDQTLDDALRLTQVNQRWFKEHVTHVVRVHFSVCVFDREQRVDLRVTESALYFQINQIKINLRSICGRIKFG